MSFICSPHGQHLFHALLLVTGAPLAKKRSGKRDRQESKERFILGTLFVLMLVAGIYDEVIRYVSH